MSDPFDADSTSAMLFCISPRKKIADIVLWMREKNVAEESKIVPAIDIEYFYDFFFFLYIKILLSISNSYHFIEFLNETKNLSIIRIPLYYSIRIFYYKMRFRVFINIRKALNYKKKKKFTR